jgi:RNA-directed DNA polymerase
MGIVRSRIADVRVVKLIRKYLTAGVLVGGIATPTDKGTPQGGPLSPLLSNILLDLLDKELERRGLTFVRYADDGNIYVTSRRAGERVMASITEFVEKRLKLKINAIKVRLTDPASESSSDLLSGHEARPVRRRRVSPGSWTRSGESPRRQRG